MRRTTKILAGLLVVAAGGWFAGCNSTIDKEPDVVLEVENLTIPVVTASQDSVTNTCTFTITNANATFKNKPKNQFAGEEPFNDILLQSIDIAYAWDDGAVAPPRTTGLGGSVPANGSSTGQFSVVSNNDLATICPTVECRSGHTAALSMTFRGETVSGDAVSVTTGGTLQVNSCTAQSFGACCTGGGACSDLSQTNCQSIGGSFQGNNTTCISTVCP
jgi:hypothetical protein